MGLQKGSCALDCRCRGMVGYGLEWELRFGCVLPGVSLAEEKDGFVDTAVCGFKELLGIEGFQHGCARYDSSK